MKRMKKKVSKVTLSLAFLLAGGLLLTGLHAWHPLAAHLAQALWDGSPARLMM